MYAIKNGTQSFRWVPDSYVAAAGESLVVAAPSFTTPDEIWDANAARVVVSLDKARARKIAETKAEAQRRIHARYPQWKQANMSARFHELRAIEDGKYRDANGVLQPARALTAAEAAEIGSFSAAWAWVKSVRAASDLIEADIAAAADPAAFDVVNSPRWPA